MQYIIMYIISELHFYCPGIQIISYLVTLIYSALRFTVEQLKMSPVDPLNKGWDK